MLTDAQVRHYQAFGFLVLKSLLSSQEVATIDREVMAGMAAQQEEPYDGSRRHYAVTMDEETPLCASLLEDPRFLGAARQLHGEDVLGVCCDANRYTGTTAWHPDMTDALYGVKFAIYLQPLTGSTGALRVIPCSHRCAWPEDFTFAIREQALEHVPAVALCSEPGDVVAFDMRTWHASYGGAADRRMVTAVYYQNPTDTRSIEAFRRQGEANVQNMIHAGRGHRRTYLYSRAWIAGGQRSVVRQRWIDRLREIGYLTAPGLIEGTSPAAR